MSSAGSFALDSSPAAVAGITDPVRDWYRANKRELPWRDGCTDAWGVLVSEIMLQQTPVSRVEPAWRNWMRQWPRPVDLAQASPADVIRAWDRLGYPRRALRLRDAAIAIATAHNGEVPSDYETLIKLPGIGDYTASAVVAFAHGKRSVVLDTNIRRVIARAVSGEQFPGGSAPTKAERQLADLLTPKADSAAAEWSVAVMELGALICQARTANCVQCPLVTACRWRQLGKPASDQPRVVQKFEGTDRQVRGRIMAMLRDSPAAVSRESLTSCAPTADQLERCLDSLLDDGLIDLRGKRFTLPR